MVIVVDPALLFDIGFRHSPFDFAEALADFDLVECGASTMFVHFDSRLCGSTHALSPLL
jgi:hypothetical protein